MNWFKRLFHKDTGPRQSETTEHAQVGKPEEQRSIQEPPKPDAVEWHGMLLANPALAAHYHSLAFHERSQAALFFAGYPHARQPEFLGYKMLSEYASCWKQIEAFITNLSPPLLAQWRKLDDKIRMQSIVELKTGIDKNSEKNCGPIISELRSAWNRQFADSNSTGAASTSTPGSSGDQSPPNPSSATDAPSEPKPSPEEFGELVSSDGWKLRQQILKNSPLRKCCEIPASAPVEGSEAMDQIVQKVMNQSGEASKATCERLLLYRLDGQALSEVETYKHVVEFVGAKGKTDAQYLSLFMKFVSAGYDGENEACQGTPVPILGFSIKLDGDKQDVIAKCEVLATTEFMGQNADFMTRGSGFTEDGVSYRVYSYWKQ